MGIAHGLRSTINPKDVEVRTRNVMLLNVTAAALAP
jgi:hypothetical protein